MFGDLVLEHHASIEDAGPDGADRDGTAKARLAMEDWAAPRVVTTNVQLFESLFAARPGRCRKLHNIAGSVIILDEAQCLPRDLLLPTLRMIDTLAAHYGCSIVLCTATQPAFDSRQLKTGGLMLEGRELAPDPVTLSGEMRRVRIVRGGAMDDAALIATSLIEAGVDLNFPVGWRAEAGLDSIVQAAGRVNRDGRAPVSDSALIIFDAPDWPAPNVLAPLIAATRKTADRFEDLLSTEAMTDWFNEVYWRASDKLDRHGIVDLFKLGRMQYRTAAEAYRLIEDTMVPVIVAIEDDASREVAILAQEQIRSGTLMRALQPFIVQIPERHRADLPRNDRARFKARTLRGDRFCVLTEDALYRPESGLLWEGAGVQNGVW